MYKLNITWLTLVLVPISATSSLANPTSGLVSEQSSNNSVEILSNRVSTQASSLLDSEAQKSQFSISPTRLFAQLDESIEENQADVDDLLSAENSNSEVNSVDNEEIQKLQSELDEIKNRKPLRRNSGSPAITIANPYGFGGDGGRFYISPSFQSDTRYGNSDDSDGTLGMGVAFGNARKTVGAELSYGMASFGGSRDFGSGGFNMKVHRRLAENTAVAFGWNGFLNIGGGNDFQDSIYGVATQIVRLRENTNSPFSRLAISGGIGNGQYRSEDDMIEDKDTVNVFGSLALRVARPVSVITEWTGQDLAIGMSISPFPNLPITFTPALRDIAGAGDGARFVFGTAIGFGFGGRF
ncbi:hypothetical protein Sta7437_2754 [Stanieria cyanosphaera PCC 7437]|uniref:Outer membrane protein beta-barrel domain-containing protein n=1 Tax=Stanieria cyanosphaera (strain ATCC 29371 / PCC 7437) TaxID=111780 RepID=K9XW33_STAC7|nr:hypothetical protein [Stanieria cyanosphaera]AFZ36279.1 hypothetical protein Sta7437_2754 [Stanieria cyanosphaera PCC 7437]